MACDVTDPDQVRALVQTTIDTFGKIDVLVNNAGINIRGRIEDLSLEEFRQVQDTNVTSIWMLCREVAPHMKARRYGRVVNIGSMLSVISIAERTPYAASKGAVLGLDVDCTKAAVDLQNLQTLISDVRRLWQAYGQFLSWSRAIGSFLSAPLGPDREQPTTPLDVAWGLPMSTSIGVAQPADEQVSQAQVEENLGRDARVGAAEDRGKRVLTGQQILRAPRLQCIVEAAGAKRLVARVQTRERFAGGDGRMRSVAM